MSVWSKINIKIQVGIDFGVNQVKVKVTVAKNRKGVVWKPGFVALLHFLFWSLAQKIYIICIVMHVWFFFFDLNNVGLSNLMYVFGSVGLFVCPVCLSVGNITQSLWTMESYRGVQGGKRKNWLNFGGDLDLLRWVNEQKHHNSCNMSWARYR